MDVQQKALLNYCIALGDDSLTLGHRLSEWCRNGPFLEEDLALTNTSLDFIGRAQDVLCLCSRSRRPGPK